MGAVWGLKLLVRIKEREMGNNTVLHGAPTTWVPPLFLPLKSLHAHCVIFAIMALWTAISGMACAKKGKNKTITNVVVHFWDAPCGPPTSWSPLVFIQSPLLILTAHPVKMNCPHPSGKGRGGVAGVAH